MKEIKKVNKYLDLLHENKKNMWNMKVTVLPVVVSLLVTFPKRFVKKMEELEIRGRIETIQIAALLRSAIILRRVQKTRGNLLLLKLHLKPNS